MWSKILCFPVISIGAVLISIDQVLGFSIPNTSQATRKQTTSPLSVATIDSAELFDGSYFEDSAKTGSNTNLLKNVGGGEVSYRASSSSVNAALERISRVATSNSGLAWAAIGAILSTSIVLNITPTTTGSSFRILSALSSWYMKSLDVSPLLTKCITGGLIALIGDYGAQWFEFKKKKSSSSLSSSLSSSSAAAKSDPAMNLRAGGVSATITATARSQRRRRKRFSIHGTYDARRGMARFLECLLISSPLMHYGYDLFESILPVGNGSHGLYKSFAALSHVFADSVFLDGIFVFTGILATGLFEGHSLRRHVLPNLRNVYFPTLKASIMTSGLLMPLEFLSFLFLPVQLRVLSVNAVDLIWTAVVSFVSHGGGDDMKKGVHSS
eukprot:CAMPEP_0183751146 /NCGR_PEP_ID=MMETSP0739-20130205/1574_1 /TAXON_ID=385413 /ORGANISM="Thalassiosira miniscula, Strain CCMP1093" /LENGTH=383 /DNA_ID=CAMNT_0025987347 /DNA_START=181 /DNA_END=1332 /DNA_ORIENTATION=-